MRVSESKASKRSDEGYLLGRFGEVKGKNQAKFQQLSAEISALGQELTAVTTATSNVIRSIGEGAAADQKLNQLFDLSQQIKNQTDSNTSFVNGLGSKPNTKQQLQASNNQTRLGTLNSQFQAVTQELSILQNVINTSLKVNRPGIVGGHLL